MAGRHSTRSDDERKSPSLSQPPPLKPAKPYPDFPLYAHRAGQWCKKIRGRFYYFGKWTDPDAALQRYLDQKDSLHAGRIARSDQIAATVKSLANAFLNQKQAMVDSGELTRRMWQDYKKVTDLLVKRFGKSRLVEDIGPDDFASLRKSMVKQGWGPVTLGNTVQRIRSVFKFAADNGLVAKAVIYGQSFKRPSKKTLRLHRAKQGLKLFSAEEIRTMLGAVGTQLRAMIFLGVNCGFGNADCGALPLTALDLEAGWVTFPRPKTGVSRRCFLWPETVAALTEALAQRPTPKKQTDSGFVFITKYGQRWAKDAPGSPIAHEIQKLLRKLKINGRKGLGFYTLRHTFRTVADDSKDSVACDFIMGHVSDDMASVYRERIRDERLRAVANTVRDWLFGGAHDFKERPLGE
jgi:integrase